MAIHRGIQSAIFFYLSCAPCSEARYRKKRRQEAVWNRAERDALEEEMPDAYRHPEPSSTNPYWQSEIALGPQLTARGGNRNKGKNAGGKASREVLSSNTSVAGASSLDLNTLQQREDEVLWGTTDMTMDGAGGTVIQRPQRAARRRGMSNETSTTTGTGVSANRYESFRSPAVSELLPPIVRTVHSREEVAWMMQPPPVAEVMSGKREGGRSGASSRQSSARMARTVSKDSAGSVLRESPRTLPADLRRPSSRGGEFLDSTMIAHDLVPMRRVASRPPLLSTIASEGNIPTTGEEARLSLVDSANSSHDNDGHDEIPPSRRPRARSTSASKKTGALKGRVFTAIDSPSPERRDLDLEFAEGELRPELFDSWYTPDFDVGRWVHEHTRREGVSKRWSFDV
ncbi:uncharacterized protein RCC_08358 [Ramularia collo-cygni]|uniref:Signal peptide-containing protein n=1 Tax=Ramularia collo-cygni TaxID=112498 RepID=A0A2D3V3V4_9PEZI|nr:uncharacterized protein RCC_08358 [Ramularia collo-cygni]CZT22653.1 uncharacterized protein RCC_08358 [Ramularia collo-cygni]